MRKRVYIALAVVLVILAGGSAWLGLREREPVYQGKRLSFWLESLNNGGPTGNDSSAAQQAIRHIGTNALPILIAKLRAQDTPLRQFVVTLVNRQKLIPLHLKSADERRWEVELGYMTLGSLSSVQVPSLCSILTNDPSPRARADAASVLGFIGPEARLAAPALFRATKDTNEIVRSDAFLSLGLIRPDPQLAIPVLVAGLEDSSLGAQLQAGSALGSYGPAAQAAVPALLRMQVTNEAAGIALKAIDPDAAAKAGVK
jgi:hypothetical protein